MKLTLSFASLLFVLSCFAQADAIHAGEIKGKVLLKGSRDPLAGIPVFLLPLKLRTVTDENGNFEFESLDAGKYQLILNAPGFARFEEEDELVQDGKLEHLVPLQRLSELIFETTIEDQSRSDVASKKISKKKAASLPGAGSDPIRAVQNMPGVNRGNGFSSQVIIQGSAPQDTKYAIDQHDIPLIFHFGGLSSVFSPDLTESYDYLSSGYRSNYGRAIGGLINVNSRDLGAKRFKASAFVDTFNAGAGFETPLEGESTLAVNFRVSYIGQVLKAASKNKDDFSLTAAPAYSDLGLVYTTSLSPTLRFKLIALGSKDSLELITKNPVNGDPALRGGFSNKISFFRLIPEFEWTHSARSKTRFSLGLGRDFFNTDFGDQYLELKSWNATVRAENTTTLSEHFILTYGLDHQFGVADVSFKLPVLFSQGGVATPLAVADQKTASLKGISSNQYGFYFNPIYHPSFDSAFTYYPGLRLDYFDLIHDLVIEPRVSARYRITPSLSYTAAAGLYAQAPRDFQTSPSYGNTELKSEKAWNFKLAVAKDLSESYSRGSELEIGLFGRWFKNLVIPDLTTVYSNQGSGQAFGLENSLKLNFYPYDFWLSYTLSRSTREDPGHASYLYRYDQTHFLTLIAGVELPRNWRISSRFRYVTGALTTPVAGAAEDIDHEVYVPIRGSLYGERLDAFCMLDLRFDKKWVYDTWTLSMYLDILNVLNRKNAEGVQYSFDYKTRENIKGLPILPTFGFKGEF